MRLNQNVSRINTTFGELGAKYAIVDWYKIGTNYRLCSKGFGLNHRIDFDNTFRIKLNDERFYFRVKVQRDFYRNAIDDDNLRLRLKYQHKFSKKFKGYVAGEYFFAWEYSEGFSNWKRQRYTGGFEYQFKNKNSLDFYYRCQDDMNKAGPHQDYIIGIGYKLELD